MNMRAVENSEVPTPVRSDIPHATTVNALFADRDLHKVTVIGAGSMGSGIAALLASAGVSVRLLDIAGPANDRNAIAQGGVQRQLKAEGFIHPGAAALVEVGNLDDDLQMIGDSDWIVEAIVEDLAIKRELFVRIERYRRENAIVSSNTSTIPLKDLIEGRSDGFRQTFVITHFFNPPRRMQLLEVIQGHADRQAHLRVERWATELLGKSVVACRDTPGFIANRIGNYWMSVASLEAIKAGITVEEADATVGQPFGVPRTGVFGLFDFVGINLVPLVWESLLGMLPQDDAHHRHDITDNELFASMLRRGLTGRFGPGGFYRRALPDGSKVDEVIDLRSGEYRQRQSPSPANYSGLRTLCESAGSTGDYAWKVLSHLVQYSAGIAPEIADDIDAIDLAMRIGYNWKFGPFELADEVGADWIVARLEQEGRDVLPLLREAASRGGFRPQVAPTTAGRERAGRQLRLIDIKQKSAPIYRNSSASLWDIGDGVACLEIHTKLNACDEHVVEALQEAVRLVPYGHRTLTIGSGEGRAFSAGAKLDVFISHVKANDWAGLRNFVASGQNALLALKYAPFPVVAASWGLTLGGGCELMMHCDAIVAHSELQAGFPERNAGIIPGWGGGTQLLLRHLERGAAPEAAALQAFITIVGCDISRSALFAREAALLRPGDHVLMSQAYVLDRAKTLALKLVDDYRAPDFAAIMVSGSQGRAALQAKIDAELAERKFTQTDAGIAEELAIVLTGGASADLQISEATMMALEVDAIVELAKRASTLARLEHLRSTNKPLRN
jgi:3-hydroxyacyl-CoA dehydrogenase